jgi:hypothetical protein
MTTDLLLSLARPDGIELVAVSVKLSKELTPRALEKLLIERLYWNRRGIRWVLATEKNINDDRACNLQFFIAGLWNEDVDKSGVAPETFARAFESHWSPKLSFNDILERSVAPINISKNLGHAILARAVWNRQSRLDLDAAKISHRDPLILMPEGIGHDSYQ